MILLDGEFLLIDLHINELIQSQPSLETAGLPMEALPTKGASIIVSFMFQILNIKVDLPRGNLLIHVL